MKRAQYVVRRLDGTVWLGWDATGELRHFHVGDVDLIKERVGVCMDVGKCDQCEIDEVSLLCRDGQVARKALTTPTGVIEFAMPT